MLVSICSSSQPPRQPAPRPLQQNKHLDRPRNAAVPENGGLRPPTAALKRIKNPELSGLRGGKKKSAPGGGGGGGVQVKQRPTTSRRRPRNHGSKAVRPRPQTASDRADIVNGRAGGSLRDMGTDKLYVGASFYGSGPDTSYEGGIFEDNSSPYFGSDNGNAVYANQQPFQADVGGDQSLDKSYDASYDLAPKPFNFGYAVNDDYHNTHFNAEQEADGGGRVRGSYSVLLPDGRTQTVEYQADHGTGYRAHVQYKGEAVYHSQPAAHQAGEAGGAGLYPHYSTSKVDEGSDLAYTNGPIDADSLIKDKAQNAGLVVGGAYDRPPESDQAFSDPGLGYPSPTTGLIDSQTDSYGDNLPSQYSPSQEGLGDQFSQYSGSKLSSSSSSLGNTPPPSTYGQDFSPPLSQETPESFASPSSHTHDDDPAFVEHNSFLGPLQNSIAGAGDEFGHYNNENNKLYPEADYAALLQPTQPDQYGGSDISPLPRPDNLDRGEQEIGQFGALTGTYVLDEEQFLAPDFIDFDDASLLPEAGHHDNGQDGFNRRNFEEKDPFPSSYSVHHKSIKDNVREEFLKESALRTHESSNTLNGNEKPEGSLKFGPQYDQDRKKNIPKIGKPSDLKGDGGLDNQAGLESSARLYQQHQNLGDTEAAQSETVGLGFRPGRPVVPQPQDDLGFRPGRPLVPQSQTGHIPGKALVVQQSQSGPGRAAVPPQLRQQDILSLSMDTNPQQQSSSSGSNSSSSFWQDKNFGQARPAKESSANTESSESLTLKFAPASPSPAISVPTFFDSISKEIENQYYP